MKSIDTGGQLVTHNEVGYVNKATRERVWEGRRGEGGGEIG